jgi:hypothetical protein
MSEEEHTVGEELFLVHLNREDKTEHAPDDYDRGEKHVPQTQTTVGEELWRVHLKRSEGLDPDYDNDGVPEEKTGKKRAKVRETIKKNSKTRGDDRVIHLRNRDVKVSVGI